MYKMKDQAFRITETTKQEYLDWCKQNNRPSYKQESKREFFNRIRTFRLCRDSVTGKLVIKRGKKQ